MPLIMSGTKEARQKNIKTLIEEGKPINQALAISYDIQRRHAKGKGWKGESARHSAARRK